MNDNNVTVETPPSQTTVNKPARKSPLVAYMLTFVLGAALSGGGVYAWFIYFEPKPAPEVKIVEIEPPSTFTYAPKVGGIEVKLPNSYLVAVASDGDNDGVEGAEFGVAAQESEHVVVNRDSGFVNVEIYKVGTSATDKANQVKGQYESEGYKNIKVTASEVNGKPAVLLTADGPEDRPGATSSYFVRSGEFLYGITGLPGTKQADIDVVIEGVTIK